jgi:hypothetical protein
MCARARPHSSALTKREKKKTHARLITSTPPPTSPLHTIRTQDPAHPPVPQKLTLASLPNDVLALILSFLPQADRFRAATSCRDLAAAARPPSAAWADIALTGAHLRDPAAYGSLATSLGRAVTSMRRLDVEATAASYVLPLVAVVAAAAPHLESLALRGDVGTHLPGLMVGVQRALATATRLTHLALGASTHVYAPPGGLPGGAWAAAAKPAFLRAAHGDPWGIRLSSVTPDLEAAAPVARLSKLGGMVFEDREGPIEPWRDAMSAFAAAARHSLTHLTIDVPAAALPRLPRLLNQLPSLSELSLYDATPGWHEVHLSVTDSIQSLTRLAILGRIESVRLSDALAARVRDLALNNLRSPDPPGFIRGDRFAHLTRLTYYHNVDGSPANLGLWSDVGTVCIPTLVELEVTALSFTLDGRNGEMWAAALAGTSLSRLSAFLIFCFTVDGELPAVQCSCRAVPGGRSNFPLTHCPGCDAEGGCEGGRAVERAINTLLPAAYARRGRILRLTGSHPKFGSTSHHGEPHLHFDPAPPE